ncbi:alpha/beta fold hydrolase [Planosporangium sp. 12N6]|uniref:alpha/beta fold hydrolase n=1 Tax=Planosporangium spinosum TaxID=3402278 RepID=UPI003CF240CD
MTKVTSRDGTTIACERVGEGPALVLVDGAMCYRAFGPLPALARVLAPDFTVYTYDRRGRGGSGDTAPYAVDREVEDLEVVIEAAGGSAYVYGISSGAALALTAAASGPAITKLALYEPPYTAEDGDTAQVAAYNRQIIDLLAAGRRGDAVERFMSGVGLPAEAIAGMRQSPAWPVFEGVAPTLAYDFAVLGDGTVPRERAAHVTVPTLVAAGGASPESLRRPAKALADAIPGATHRVLEGQTHEVSPDAIAAVLREFF